MGFQFVCLLPLSIENFLLLLVHLLKLGQSLYYFMFVSIGVGSAAHRRITNNCTGSGVIRCSSFLSIRTNHPVVMVYVSIPYRFYWSWVSSPQANHQQLHRQWCYMLFPFLSIRSNHPVVMVYVSFLPELGLPTGESPITAQAVVLYVVPLFVYQIQSSSGDGLCFVSTGVGSAHRRITNNCIGSGVIRCSSFCLSDPIIQW